jgi:hypothetical protein
VRQLTENAAGTALLNDPAQVKKNQSNLITLTNVILK